MSPIDESPMKQAGGKTCKTLRRSSQTGISRVQRRWWRSARPYSVGKEGSCHISSVQSTSGRSLQGGSGRLLLDLMVGPTSPTSSYGQLFVRGRSQPTCLHRSGVLAACGPDGFGQVNLLKWAQGEPYLWAQESDTNNHILDKCEICSTFFHA
ncbi:hypothetical protein PIB30_017995 [Stylosanthes scabra]|uniref:Uncharacterized protein n=1 Tax=Stylosanthes scabra TaxID=79078 RepID=A0ABU6U9D5_9FABA|nr:hypothetical protein [Stylosanthes scabra]